MENLANIKNKGRRADVLRKEFGFYSFWEAVNPKATVGEIKDLFCKFLYLESDALTPSEHFGIFIRGHFKSEFTKGLEFTRSGALIIDRKPIDDKSEYVLCKWTSRNEFVTWLMVSETKVCYYGHYFSSLDKAHADFKLR